MKIAEANSKFRFDAFFKWRRKHHITLWRIEDRRVAVVASSQYRRCGEWRRQIANGVHDIRGKSRATTCTRRQAGYSFARRYHYHGIEGWREDRVGGRLLDRAGKHR